MVNGRFPRRTDRGNRSAVVGNSVAVVERALAWAEEALDESIVDSEPLAGGFTSTMVSATCTSGRLVVLRLMTEEPWRTHGAELTRREQAALQLLAGTSVPAPRTIALDATGAATGVAAHLMERLPGRPTPEVDETRLAAMAAMLATIHGVRPDRPFRAYQSWAWGAKRVVPPWTRHPDSWRRAFTQLAEQPPDYEPTFLHRDYSHRNLVWTDHRITGVVDWVETSTGPAWLDAAHAATNLAVAFGIGHCEGFLSAFAAETAQPRSDYWLLLDAVGFLPPPGKKPMFDSDAQLAGLDEWLHHLVTSGV